MSPGWRKIGLTAHVIASVGWFGAVAAFFALAVAGVVSADPSTARAAYVANGLITSLVIVPLALTSVLTGVVQSLGTSWGLLRHWWVLVKLVMTLPATLLLLLHTGPIGQLASSATEGAASAPHASSMAIQLVVQAGGALVVLAVVTGLSVYKPPGRTSFGRW